MVEQFYDVFRECNNAVWPAQWLLVTAGQRHRILES